MTTATTAPDHPAHIPALDGLRALSICLVMAAHMLPLGPKSWAFNAMAAKMGMSLFFCLSGFLIVSMLYRNPDVPTFLIRRVLRIVPAVAMYMLVLVVLFDLSQRVVALNLAFVTNYQTEGLTGGLLGHMWSLSVEMQFYMAMAMAVLALGRRAVWLVPPAAILITLLRVQAGAYVNIVTHLRVDEILSGGTLALVALHYGDRLRAVLAPMARSLPLLAVLVALWTLSSRDDAGALNYLRPYLAAGVVGCAIWCRWQPLVRALSCGPARYVAQISYALYIYHFLSITGWMNTGNDLTRYLIKRPLSFALLWAMAHASTFWWEARFQALARRLTPSRPSNPRPSDAHTGPN